MSNDTVRHEADRRALFTQIMRDYHSGDPRKQEKAKETYLFEIKGYLIETIKKYAGFLVNDQSDLLNECCITALKKLPDYDPEKGAVTTFLKRDLLHTISLYIADNSYHTTAYYGKLASKVNRTISALQVIDIEPTAANIALKADISYSQAEIGLAIITASSEQYYESYTHGEDLIRKVSDTPEEEYIKSEGLEVWYAAMSTLPSRAVSLFLLYYGITDEGIRYSYAMLGRQFHISPKQAALEIASVRRHLQADRNLQEYYNRKNPSVIRDSVDTLISTIPMEWKEFYERAYRFIREEDFSDDKEKGMYCRKSAPAKESEEILDMDFSALMIPLGSSTAVFATV